MISTLKRLKKQLKHSWGELEPGYLRAALDVLENAGATSEQVDAYCKLWARAHAATEVGDCKIPCVRCFLVGRTHWLVRAPLGTGAQDESAWRSGFVCDVCGYAPHVPSRKVSGHRNVQ